MSCSHRHANHILQCCAPVNLIEFGCFQWTQNFFGSDIFENTIKAHFHAARLRLLSNIPPSLPPHPSPSLWSPTTSKLGQSCADCFHGNIFTRGRLQWRKRAGAVSECVCASFPLFRMVCPLRLTASHTDRNSSSFTHLALNVGWNEPLWTDLIGE